MKPISDSVCCVCDNGGFFAVAERLAREDGFKKVYYVTSWQAQFPSIQTAEIGSRWTKKTGQDGFGIKPKEGMNNVWLVRSMFQVFDEVDVWVMPDVYHGQAADWLRKQGKAVWGSGGGEELELNREGAKRLLQRLGLPMGEFKTVVGMDNLEKFLEANDYKDWFCKISRWRGIYESFAAEDFRAIKGDMRHHLSEFADFIPFTVEKRLKDKVELGLDIFTVNGEYPAKTLGGIEIKDACFYGRVQEYERFPAPMREVTDALKQTFRDFGYIGPFSTECRIGADHKAYTIDLTTRIPVPPGPAMLEAYTNFPAIVHGGAHGVMVQPEEIAIHIAEVKIHCGFTADGNWVEVMGAENHPKNVKLCNQIMLGDSLWVMPQSPPARDIGSVIGWGKTKEAAFEMCRGVAKEIKGHTIDIPVEDFNDADEVLEKSEKMGLPLSSKEK